MFEKFVKKQDKEQRTQAKRERLAKARNERSEKSGEKESVQPGAIPMQSASDVKQDAVMKRGAIKKKHRGISKLTLLAALFCLLISAILVIKLISYIGGISRTELSGEGFTHDARYDNCLKIKGIDVSEFQGDINWKKVKSSGADFAFIRAALRRSDTGELLSDAKFEENIKAANKSGIMAGAYIYSQAVNADEAEEEADFLVSLVKKYDIDLPLVIDYELYPGGRLEQAVSNGDLYAASQFNEITTVFCRRVEAAGYESAIYGNYDMFTNYMDATLIDDKYTLWAAQYGGSCDVAADYMFWQASDQAMSGGIEGSVDLDFWYIVPGKVYSTEAAGKKKQVSIGKCEVRFDDDDYEIRNHRAIPKVTVISDGKTLKEGRDYEVSFIQNIKPGTGYAIVRGIKKYKDWKAVPFTIG